MNTEGLKKFSELRESVSSGVREEMEEDRVGAKAREKETLDYRP